MILDVYREESKRDYNTDSFPEMHSKEFQEKCDELREGFLDEVFGLESQLPREKFIVAVCNKAGWIFKSEKVR